MSPGPSPSVRRRRLGAELRRLRETAGLTGDQVIARIGWASASKLSRLENGRSRPDLSDILDLLDLYAVRGAEREGLIAVARDAGNTRGWLRSYPVMTQRQRAYAELESGCVGIREYAPAIVPGLLQTPAYARVRIQSSTPLRQADLDDEPDTPPDTDTEVAARLARQAILTRRAEPPRYEAVIEETVLTTRSGPADVMREQVLHLRELTELPNVVLRVLIRDTPIADHYLPQTAFSLYRFADPADPEMVTVESLVGDMQDIAKQHVQRHAVVFEWLREAAMSPDETRDWLAAVAEKFVFSPE